MKHTLKIFIALLTVMFSSTNIFAAEHGSLFHPDKTNDEILTSLINSQSKKFTVETFSDDVTGLSIKYNIYLPEKAPHEKLPVVFFIADGSASGKDPEFSLTQGYGALVWGDYDCAVIVPTYPKMILDDHDGFVVSDYVELTARFVNYALKNYNLDEKRVYATGQSMGCMTFLILAAKYPELFTACLFVSGQWDINKLTGLIGQKFIYAASNGDDKASKGQREVIEMFNKSEVPYVSYQNIDAKNNGIKILNEQPVNFVTFKAKTTLPEGTKGNYSEHMTSFDYVYKNSEFTNWLLAQTKGE